MRTPNALPDLNGMPGTIHQNVDVVMLRPNGSSQRSRRRRRNRRRQRQSNRNQDGNEPPVPALPIELWSRVLSFLDPKTLLRAQTVCRSWRDAISDVGNGVLWRDAVKHEMKKWKSKRLAYPKKAFQKLEAGDSFADYRDYALVSLMRTCPECNKVLILCRDCGLGECMQCSYKDRMPLPDIPRLCDRFELPRELCIECDPMCDDEFFDHHELLEEYYDNLMLDGIYYELDDEFIDVDAFDDYLHDVSD